MKNKSAYKLDKNINIPSDIMNVVKAHKFYVEAYTKAKELKNVEMITYYVDKMKGSENQIAFNLHKYL